MRITEANNPEEINELREKYKLAFAEFKPVVS